ncbi:cytochrome c oxidase accessory protein CcoG [Arsenicibacter rosenii]|uniref:Cytochrome c oxidase accessory protein CcoG n=1 Tax=Arsenicibacter rosenii TaxID=1750698 RepID=A0A1S2VNY3_9BACT|nr:cytochrome c oxidase accessory protein CcoG [Arsenicibacter rosenii]OIN60110.1 cytochrome c oxidase accessory protein CcoG [Arsenicibacter rosenii]
MIAEPSTNNLPGGTQPEDSFRDHISIVDEAGHRIWLHPKKPKGKWYRYRSVFTAVLLAVLVVVPFLRINGEPLVLFNFFERRFIVFGITFWPPDFWMFGLAMVSFVVFVALFSSVYGRLWCGWACPQTLFMEMVFRRIEYIIDGDGAKQKALAAAPWTGQKLAKRVLKYTVFLAISFFVANLMLSYLIGTDDLLKVITDTPAHNWSLFIAILVFTALFFFSFTWLREQACTIVCPYGRLQSVLTDKKSLTVAYDYRRGEPRGKLRKNTDRQIGDCIDCKQCVFVCPTGIDIRNGTQLECVQCTACIDACDSIMETVNMPTGLIRYTTEESIQTGKPQRFPMRAIGYSAILAILWGVLGFALVTRTDTRTNILRAPGSPYQELPNGTVQNLYTYKIFNRTNEVLQPEIRLEGVNGKLQFIGNPPAAVPKGQSCEGSVFIILPASALHKRKTELTLTVSTAGTKPETVTTTFIAPEQ